MPLNTVEPESKSKLRGRQAQQCWDYSHRISTDMELPLPGIEQGFIMMKIILM
jgi:hypothetical protein